MQTVYRTGPPGLKEGKAGFPDASLTVWRAKKTAARLDSRSEVNCLRSRFDRLGAGQGVQDRIRTVQADQRPHDFTLVEELQRGQRRHIVIDG